MRAQGLLDWLDATLFEPARGLYLDGAWIKEGKLVVAEEIYTYNQGPVLGALLELGGDANLARGAALVGSVAEHLTVREPDTQGRLVLRGEGTGDGGLFTGILVRYLALAAGDVRLPAPPALPRGNWSSIPRRLCGGTDGAHRRCQRSFRKGRRRLARLLDGTAAPGGRDVRAGHRRRTLHPAAGVDGVGSRRARPIIVSAGA